MRMVNQVNHLLYISEGGQGRVRLANMLAADFEAQPSLVLLPENALALNEPGLLPTADLYLLDLSEIGPERLFALVAAVKQRTPPGLLLVLAEAAQEALAAEAVDRGADYYLLWGQFDSLLLRHVLRLLLRTVPQRRAAVSPPDQNNYADTSPGWRNGHSAAPSLNQSRTRLEQSFDSNEILRHFLVQLQQVVAYDTASIVFVNDDVASVAEINVTDPDLQDVVHMAPVSFLVSQTANLRQLAETKRPFSIPDVDDYDGWIKLPQSDHIRSWMGAPIIVRDQFVAMLDVAKREPNFYTGHDLDYLAIFADQAGLVLHNTQLYEETRRQFERLKVLHTIAVLGASVSQEDELIEKATQVIGEALYPKNFGVLLVDEAGEELLIHPSYHKQNWNYEWQSVPLELGIVGHVARSKRPYRTGDVSNDPYYVRAELETRSQLAVPLLLNDRVLGVINTESAAPYAFSERDEQLLLTLAGQLSITIEKFRLLAAERARRQEAETLSQAAAVLTSTLDLNQVLDRILEQLEQVVAYDSASVLMLQGDYLYLQAERGLPPNIVGEYFPADNALFVAVQQSKRPLYLKDARQDDRFQAWGGITHTRGWLGVPLISRDEVLGLLAIDSRHIDAYTELDITLAQSLADQAAVAITNAQLYESTRSSAEELRLVTEALRVLNATPVFEDAFPAIYQMLQQITGADAICLAILEQNNRWDCAFISSDETVTGPNNLSFSLNHFSGLDQLTAGKPHIIDDLSQVRRSVSDEQAYEAGYRSLAMIPLMGKRPLGVIKLLWQQRSGCNQNQLPLLNQLANASALALERSRLFSETNRQAEQLQLLNELGRQLSGQIDIQTLCQTVVDTLRDAFAYPNISVFLADESNEYAVLQAIAGQQKDYFVPGQYRQAMGQGLIGRVAYTGEKLVVNDTRNYADFQSSPYARILSELVLPLKANEQILGVLNIDSDQLNTFSENDVVLLTLVADQLATALEKARLFDETHRRTAELEAVGQISTVLRQSNNTEEMLPLILDHCLQIAGGKHGSIYLIEPESGDLVARWSVPPVDQTAVRRYKPHQGITGYVATTGEIYITNNLRNDPLAHFVPEELTYSHEIQGAIGLPLRAQERVVGVILLSLGQRQSYSRAEVRLLKAISDIAGSALDRAMVLETLEQRVEARTHELAEANERLQELDNLKSKFISDMSHELRTPITNLGLYIDLLQQGRPEKQAYYVDVLRQQIARLGQLMTDILSLSRVEMARGRVTFAPMDFNRIVMQTVSGLQMRAEEASINLTVELASDLPMIEGEANQLSQIVSNLLSNAINYSLAGQDIVVRTRLQQMDDANGVCLIVADTGKGIPEEEQALIFQRFYRGQQVGQSNLPGTGLGLAIVQEVIGLHGGRIELESEPGKGSTFRVWLPLPPEV